MRWMRRFARSMLAQTLLLTGVFLAGSIYVVAVRPVLDYYPDLEPPDPRDRTREAVRGVLWKASTSGRPPTEVVRTIARDPVYRAVMARNPGFRYSMIIGGRFVGTMPPAYYHRVGLDRLARVKSVAGPSDASIQFERVVQDAAGLGYVLYINDKGATYLELSGIRHAIVLPTQPPLWQVYLRLIWKYGRDFLIPALTVFFICITILSAHIITIRRVARLIRPAEGDVIVSSLSERGIPSEVLPLTRAINRMIAHVADVEQRQRFFLSAAAHEMRTPLTVLRTRLEMVDEQDLRHKLVGDVRRLTRLVNGLLTLMSVRERHHPDDDVDLVTACKRVISALTPVAMGKGVVLRLLGEPVVVTGDGPLIEVAITNLVANAITFSPDGGVVTIAITPDRRVVVADQGAGVPDDKIRMVFEPFVRFTNKSGGYGLGLTIVKAIADLHNASVEMIRGSPEGTIVAIDFATPVASATNSSKFYGRDSIGPEGERGRDGDA